MSYNYGLQPNQPYYNQAPAGYGQQPAPGYSQPVPVGFNQAQPDFSYGFGYAAPPPIGFTFFAGGNASTSQNDETIIPQKKPEATLQMAAPALGPQSVPQVTQQMGGGIGWNFPPSGAGGMVPPPLPQQEQHIQQQDQVGLQWAAPISTPTPFDQSSIYGGVANSYLKQPKHSKRETYEEIVKECRRSGKLWEDPDFRPCSASISTARRLNRPVEWKRPPVSG